MLKSPFLFAVSVLIALVHWTGAAKAQDLGLSFDLPPTKAHNAVVETQTPAAIEDTIKNSEPTAPVRVEIATLPAIEKVSAELPPIESDSVESHSSVDSDSVAVQLETPGPEILEAETAQSETIGLSFAKDTLSGEPLAHASDIQLATEPDNTTALLFDETTDLLSGSTAEYDVTTAVSNWGETLGLDDWIFEHGTQSLVARTVGSAEGTRQSDGRHTAAYYGHVDPGNGVWNLGTFSYQHEATSPEEADEKQLRRLKRQGLELEEQARKHGFTLSLTEKLNGLDLANQAPLAALDRGGYIDWLAQAKRLQMEPQEAILWARTHSYIDPDTRQWNAPGLGNNINSISRDQDRRMVAISDALKAYNPTSIDGTSLASAAGISLQSHGLDSQANRLAALGSPEIAQHVLSEIEVSFGLPPVEASPVDASSALVAVTEPPQVEPNNEVVITDANVDESIGVKLLPTGSLAEITPQPVAIREEESRTEDDLETDQSNPTQLAETEKPEETETEIVSTTLATSAEESLDSETEATNTETTNVETMSVEELEMEASETEAKESETTSKLQDLLSGVSNRGELAAKSEADSGNTLTSESEVTESEKPAADRASLWHTEDKIVQTK